jgi:hypothetical protein
MSPQNKDRLTANCRATDIKVVGWAGSEERWGVRTTPFSELAAMGILGTPLSCLLLSVGNARAFAE